MNTAQLSTAKVTSTPRPNAIATLRNVSRYFECPGFVRALVNATFEIRQGEIFGVLGPKGSGKSTVLRVLAGQLSASEGKVRVFGRSPRRPGVKVRIGYLPEEKAQGDVRSIRAFLNRFFGLARRPRKVTGEAENPGRKRWAKLAQILARSPQLIILDEPFVDLDQTGREELKEMIRDLARRGKTVVLSSDSFVETIEVCNCFAVLYAGAVQAVGTLAEVIAHPDAIRITAPLLPIQTAERVSKIINEELVKGNVTTGPSGSKFETVADGLLTPLLHKTDSAAAEHQASSSPSPKHEKLEKLTKCAADSPGT